MTQRIVAAVLITIATTTLAAAQTPPAEPAPAPTTPTPAAPDATAAAVKAALEEDRKARDDKARAESAYEAERVRFQDVAFTLSTGKTTTTGLATIAYRGERRLSTPEFFEAVERPDLAARYNRRRNIGIGALITGSAVMLGSLYVMYSKGLADRADQNCMAGPDLYACFDRERAQQAEYDREASKWLKIGLGIGVAGLAIDLVGYYYLTTANPVSMNEAHDLADQHNARLKQKHGLTSTTRVTPYATPDGGGLALLGRF